jgi:hypothetical protein
LLQNFYCDPECFPAIASQQIFSSGLAGSRPLRRPFISGDDPGYQFMTDHVFSRELHLRDTLDAIQQLRRFRKT